MSDGFNFDASIREALVEARRIAGSLGSDSVGTEHELLALLASGDDREINLFVNLGVERGSVEKLVKDLVRPSPKNVTDGADLPFTRRAKRVLELAMAGARYLGSDFVGNQHLLMGLVAESKGIAAQALQSHGVTVNGTVAAVARALGINPPSDEWAIDELYPRVERGNPRTPHLDALRATWGDVLDDFRGLALVADLSLLDVDAIVEVLASLDMLHRAWGGAGLVIKSQTVGATVADGAIA
jgi:ATP-dependent Clp protease ATP-binding subunit ClpC